MQNLIRLVAPPLKLPGSARRQLDLACAWKVGHVVALRIVSPERAESLHAKTTEVSMQSYYSIPA